jgi:hypothetical protein
LSTCYGSGEQKKRLLIHGIKCEVWEVLLRFSKESKSRNNKKEKWLLLQP